MSSGDHNFTNETETLRQLVKKHWDLNAVNNSIILSLKNHGSKPAREKLFKKREDIAEEIADLEEGIGIDASKDLRKKLITEPYTRLRTS